MTQRIFHCCSDCSNTSYCTLNYYQLANYKLATKSLRKQQTCLFIIYTHGLECSYFVTYCMLHLFCWIWLGFRVTLQVKYSYNYSTVNGPTSNFQLTHDGCGVDQGRDFPLRPEMRAVLLTCGNEHDYTGVSGCWFKSHSISLLPNCKYDLSVC